MIRTSETWRQETRENIRQAAGLAAISIGVFDATAAPDAQVEIPEPLWAGDSVLDDGLPVCYAVYEPAFFRLDRRQLLLPKEWGAMQSQRFVGNAQADGIGLFKQAQEKVAEGSPPVRAAPVFPGKAGGFVCDMDGQPGRRGEGIALHMVDG